MQYVKLVPTAKIFFIAIPLAFGLMACGGSDSNDSDNTHSECQNDSIQTINANNVIDADIDEDATQCFKFSVTENATYQLLAKPKTGYVAFAAHKTSDQDDDSVIVYSLDPFNNVDGLIFTAESSGDYFVELYAVETSQYSLELKEVNTNDYLSVDTPSLSISAISTHLLPANQRLIQPSINTQLITATYSNTFGSSPTVSFSNSTSAPDWLTFDATTSTDNTSAYEYTIARTDLPVGVYEATGRLVHTYHTNLRVFQSVNLNYILSAPPFTLTSTHTPLATIATGYTFSLIDDAQQPLSYSFDYAPNGMTIDANGQANWQPAMPMFTETMDIHWGIRSTLKDISIVLEDTTTLSSNTFTEPVIRTGMTFSEFVYDGNMVSADLDNDGKTEIILSDMEKVLYSVEYDNGDYHEDWVNPFSLSDTQKINTLAVEDLNQDGTQELIIGMWQIEDHSYTQTPAAKIIIIDGVNKKIVNSISVDVEIVRSIYSGDIDNDGNIELVVFGTTDSTMLVRIYEGIDLTLEWSSAPLQSTGGLSEIRLGNIDADPALEIVTGMGHVIDGLTHSIEVIKPDGFPGYAMTITVGDVDNDGIDDIVHSTNDFMYIYDGSGVVKYHFDSSELPQFYSGRFRGAIVGDISGEGNNHLIVSVDNTFDEVAFYMFNKTTSTFEVDRRVNHVSSTIDGLLLDDFDNDGSIELLWREGGRSTTKDGLVIAGFQAGINTADIEWYTDNPSEYDAHGFFTPHHVKNLSNENKIWFISNDSEELDSDITINRGSRLLNLDLSTKNLTTTNPIYTDGASIYSTPCNYFSNFMAYDLNLDTVKDAIIAPCQKPKPAILIDLQDNTTIQSSVLSLTSSSPGEVEAMDIGDFGNNGSLEVAAVTQYGAVFVYDPLTNILLWEHDFGFGSSGENVIINDLDDNGSLELIVALNQKIVIFNYNSINSTFTLDREILLNNISDIVIADMNGDNIDEIMVVHGVDYNRSLTTYDNAFNSVASHKINHYVSSMHVENLPGTRKNILLATEDSIGFGVSRHKVNKLRSIDPYTGIEVWQSPNLLGSIPINSLNYADVNDDLNLELIFTTQKAINVIY